MCISVEMQRQSIRKKVRKTENTCREIQMQQIDKHLDGRITEVREREGKGKERNKETERKRGRWEIEEEKERERGIYIERD